MTSRPEIMPATADDLVAFYGVKPVTTIKAIVAKLEGQLVGIGGIEYVNRTRVAFCWVKPELKVFPFEIVRAAHRMLKAEKGPIIAYGDLEEPTSDKFLSRLGFNRHGTTPIGEVYIHV